MFGWIHCSLKMMLNRKHGEEVWDRIMKLGEFTEDMANMNKYYEDRVTFRIVSCTSNVIGVPVDEVWEAYGSFLINFTMETGWDELLRALAPDLEGFLQTLDSLHYFIDRVVYQAHLKGPSFRVEEEKSSKDAKGLLLHYYSNRRGLYPIVKGVVREIAFRIYDMEELVIRVLERKQGEGEGDTVQEHVTFRVSITKDEDAKKMSRRRGARELESSRCETAGLQLVLADFVKMFPIHVCFDQQLRLLHFGLFFKKLFPFLSKEETRLGDVMELTFPEISPSFDSFRDFLNGVFVFRLTSPYGASATHPIFVKGQMIPLCDGQTMLYAASFNSATIGDLLERQLHLADMPLHDTTRDLILLNQSRMSQVELNVRLEETQAELKSVAAAVQQEQEKTDALLSELMPPTISQALRSGASVGASSFAAATVLFSDIVSFTNLCAATTPIGVVELLNALYLRFDRLVSTNGVYKVETIGDAYMVSGGVPDECEDHAAKKAEPGPPAGKGKKGKGKKKAAKKKAKAAEEEAEGEEGAEEEPEEDLPPRPKKKAKGKAKKAKGKKGKAADAESEEDECAAPAAPTGDYMDMGILDRLGKDVKEDCGMDK